MEDDEILIETSPVYLYNIPARLQRREGYMHRASDWDVQKPDWSGKIALVAAGPECCHLQLEDNDGDVFAQAVIDSYPTTIIQPVLDSKRFFVLKIQKISGNYELAGIGYSTRQDSGLFMDTLEEYFTKPSTNPVPKRPSSPPKMVMLPPVKKLKVNEPSSSTVQQTPIETGSTGFADTTSQEGGDSSSVVKPNPDNKVANNNGSIVSTEIEHVIPEPAPAMHTDQAKNGVISNTEKVSAIENKISDSNSPLDKPGSNIENSESEKQVPSDSKTTKVDVQPKAQNENENNSAVKPPEEPITSSTDDTVQTEINAGAQETSADQESNMTEANQSQETGDCQSTMVDTTVSTEGALDILDTEEQEMDATCIETLQPTLEALTADADPFAAIEECLSDADCLEIVKKDEFRDVPRELGSGQENRDLVVVDKTNDESAATFEGEQQNVPCEDAPTSEFATAHATAKLGVSEDEHAANQAMGDRVVPCDSIDSEKEMPSRTEGESKGDLKDDVNSENKNKNEQTADNFEQEDEQFIDEEENGEETHDLLEGEQDGEETHGNDEELAEDEILANEEELLGDGIVENEDELLQDEITGEEEQTGEEIQANEEDVVEDENPGGEETYHNQEENFGEETQDNDEEQDEGVTKPRVTLMISLPKGYKYQDEVGGPFKCHKCPEIFDGYNLIQRHWATVHKFKQTGHCSVCLLPFPNRSEVADHRKRIHGFTCEECGKQFKKEIGLKDHQKNSHGIISAYVCTYCPNPIEFKLKNQLVKHIQSKHESTSGRTILVTCSTCSEKFLSEAELKQHELKHQNSLACPHCDQKFKGPRGVSKRSLNIHIAEVHPDAANPDQTSPRRTSNRFPRRN